MTRDRSAGCPEEVAENGAPGKLELVRLFVNSLDVEEATDEFATRAATARWLRSRALLGAREPVSESERRRLISLRESLRGVLEAHNGRELAPDTYERLNAAVGAAALTPRFDANLESELVPQGKGADAAIATLAAIIREAEIDGSWARLKVCPASDCRWAFYDQSRNHSRTWCEMGYCGNRAKVRAFRERRAS